MSSAGSKTGTEPCPCGSGKSLATCCLPLVDGAKLASTPESLMRSRYTAFALGTKAAIDYLVATHHADFRGEDLRAGLVASVESIETWEGLQIVETQTAGDTGVVTFMATYRQGAHKGQLRERSQFVREDGCWLYTTGEVG